LDLADHILIEVGDYFARSGDLIEEFLGRATPPLLLVENRGAELDAFTTDVDIAWTFDQRPHITVAFATERTEGVLFRCATAASSTTGHDILT
jgi:hypothetical protein